MAGENGVIISVYTESTNAQPGRKPDPIKKMNPKRLSHQRRVFKTRGYDRRAQLLAYAQELRQANAQRLELPLKNSKIKPKKWRWKAAVEKMRRLFSRFDGEKRSWKYEEIVSEDYGDGEGSCEEQRKKKSRNRRRDSDFCKKLKCLLKKLSRVLKCKIDSFGEDV